MTFESYDDRPTYVFCYRSVLVCCTQVDKGPMLCIDSFLIEEKGSALLRKSDSTHARVASHMNSESLHQT